GKEKVVSHHQDVPYRVLEHKYGFTADASTGAGKEQTEPTNSGNKIIHGDNLEALKSLLPEYEGKVKCIYIDPPYNTGNESWVYNDNVNHPKIKKWLGEVVGKDGEDLTRHDKWLCMMYPRLKLLHKLLADDGAIFISIDHNEQSYLKLLCDEIFGRSNFIFNFSRVTKKAGKSSDVISFNNDNLFFIQKSNKTKFYPFEHNDIGFKHSDVFVKERGLYKLNQTLDYGSIQYSASLDYEIEIEGDIFRPGNVSYEEMHQRQSKNPKSDFCWRWSKDLFEFGLKNGFIVIKKSKNGKRIYTKTYQKCTINKQNGYSLEYNKRTKALSTLEFIENRFSNDNSKKELESIFGTKVFEYSKPSILVETIIKFSTDKNSIILDSFAGSGTTAHAVLNLNKQDGGNRKFILVEMEDYANDITAERVKRVAQGYGASAGSATAKKVEGTGGAFDFYELGLPLFDENQNLNEKVDIEKIREYIWFSETRTSAKLSHQVSNEDDKYFLGEKDETVYYFIYEKDQLTTLDFDALELIKIKGEQYVIYADNCLLPKEFMAKKNIVFKKIPRDITRF
ncbi:MAG TPA: site-specific DNA-methyltransferase, partial [Flavobacterium sp.]|nr:site-specific DNA-methyltransferase [Flavobacterium sp.]